MAVTAFFESKKSILSISQFLSLLGTRTYTAGDELINLSVFEKTELEQAARCPMCRCSGAVFVSAAKDKSRQAYLKFINDLGEECHHAFCDYSENLSKNVVYGHLSYRQKSRSIFTSYIDQFTSKAILEGIFTQEDILSFREHILSISSEIPHQFSVTTESIVNARNLIFLSFHHKNKKKKTASSHNIQLSTLDELVNSSEFKGLEADFWKQRIRPFTKSALERFIKVQSCANRPEYLKLKSKYEAATSIIWELKKSSINLIKMDFKKDFSPILSLVSLLLYVFNDDKEQVKNAFLTIDAIPDLPEPLLGCALGFIPFKFYHLDNLCEFFESRKTLIDNLPQYSELIE